MSDVKPPKYKAVAAAHTPVAPRESARPESTPERFDDVADVVVVGSGCAGLSTALFSAWSGLSVIVLEKAPEIGGTTRKSAFWTWVPNNPFMRDLGIVDDERDFLRYCVRTARPEKYVPEAEYFGASRREFDMFRAIYHETWPAVMRLHDMGGLRFRAAPDFVDYLGHLSEDTAPRGRVLVPEGSNLEMTDGGLVAIESMSTAAHKAGVAIRPGHRVQRLITREKDVLGVVASRLDGVHVRIAARRGVVFASGGFTHDKDLTEQFLAFPSIGGCAARTNEGDFVRIGPSVGAQLGNMQFAWRTAVPLEKVAAEDPHMNGTTSWPGDSMIGVNLEGNRCLNEKLPYNELAAAMCVWDPRDVRYPNWIMLQIWDQRAQDNCQAQGNGSIMPLGYHDHIISAPSLDDLAAEAGRRLSVLRSVTGGAAMAPDFTENLHRTIARWNVMATRGVDEDFGRGGTVFDIEGFGGPVPSEPGKMNPVMWPIASTGPYYGALVGVGTLDTKGGPKTDLDGRVLDDLDFPIPGLYGVGNCVAAPQGRSYWAGGATLGPMIAFAHRVAESLAAARGGGPN